MLPTPSRTATVVIALALGTVAAALASGFWPYTTDDQYITLRYARRLAEGHGLVYNPGEAVEGFSNPVWTLVLSVPLWAGLDGMAAAKCLALLSHGAAVATVVLGAWRAGGRDPRALGAGVLGGSMLALSLPAAWWASQALETAPYGLLLLVAVVLLLLESPTQFPWSAVAAGLAGISRPEGPLLAAALGFARLCRIRSRDEWVPTAQWAVVALTPILAWTTYRWITYGELVPNTFYVKGGVATAHELHNYLVPFLANEWPFLAAGVAGLVVLSWSDPRAGLVPGCLLLAHGLFLLSVGGDWMPNQRFVAPGLPVLALAAALGVARLGDRHRAIRVPSMLALLALAALHAPRVSRWRLLPSAAETGAERTREDLPPGAWQRGFTGSAYAVSRYLLAHVRPDASLAYSEIGLCAFISNWHILDLVGLVTRETGGATGLDTPGKLAYVKSRAPDWIVLRNGGAPVIRKLKDAEWLRHTYTIEDGGPGGLLFARRNDVANATPDEVWQNLSLAIRWQPRFAPFHTDRVEAALSPADRALACADARRYFASPRIPTCDARTTREPPLAAPLPAPTDSTWQFVPASLPVDGRARLVDGELALDGQRSPKPTACLRSTVPASADVVVTMRYRLGGSAGGDGARITARYLDDSGKPISGGTQVLARAIPSTEWVERTAALVPVEGAATARLCVDNGVQGSTLDVSRLGVAPPE